MTQNHTVALSVTGRLAAAYAKYFLHNPKDVVYANIERALNDCPDIVRACDAHDDLVIVLKELFDDWFAAVSIDIEEGCSDAIALAFKVDAALAKAKAVQ